MKKRVHGAPPPKAWRKTAAKGSVAGAQKASKTPRMSGATASKQVSTKPMKASPAPKSGGMKGSPPVSKSAMQPSVRAGTATPSKKLQSKG